MSSSKSKQNQRISVSNMVIQNVESIELPIYAYLTPHPLDEDRDFEEEWMEGMPGFKLDCEDNPLFDDDNIDFYNTAESLISSNFQVAANRFNSLLAGKTFTSIQICIDFLGYIMYKGKSLASYYPEGSEPEEGLFLFFAHYPLLMHYLKNHYVPEYKLNDQYQLIWEHEIIHLLDHENSIVANEIRNSNNPDNIYRYYLALYRSEGLADLYFTLKGHNDFKDYNAALAKFQEKTIATKILLSTITIENVEDIREQIYDEYVFYEVGPWLIIKMLADFGDEKTSVLVNNCVAAMLKDNPASDADIMELIKAGLAIDNNGFIENLKKLML